MRVTNVSSPETQQTIGDLIDNATEKVTPVDADKVPLSDSAGGKILKWISWSDLKAALLNFLTVPRASQNVPYILAQSAVPKSFISVNTGLTWTLAANPGNGYTRITSNAGHGLTSAVANGKNVYIASWAGGTVGFVNVANVVDATNIDLSVPYSAGYGSPSVVAANTEVTLTSVTVPGGAMGANGSLWITQQLAYTPSTNAKSLKNRFGGVQVVGTVRSVGTETNLRAEVQIANRAATNVQICSNNFFAGTGSGASVVMSLETMLNQIFAITCSAAVANEVITLEFFQLEVLPGA